MALLWVEDRFGNSVESEWLMQSLDGESAVPLASTALLLCSRSATEESWLLMGLAPAAVMLNGAPLHAGIRLLTDRDEIRVDGLGRAFFSTQRLARVEPFPGADRRLDCPRCKTELVAGQPAVRCPACGRWFHQSAERPCWTYLDRCLCPQPTALDAGYQWTPNGL